MNATAIDTDNPILVVLDAGLTPHLQSIADAHPIPPGSLWHQLATDPDVPESLLFAFLKAGLCLEELAHRRGPVSLLEQLANRFHAPEAIVTLLTQAYSESAIPDERFGQLLNGYGHDCEWALDSLDRTRPSSSQKRAIYLAFLEDVPSRRQVIDASTEEARAKDTRSSTELRELFVSRDPRVLRAIADNPNTPLDLLEKLSSHEGTPLARVIRSLASVNLKSRRHGHD